MSLVLRPVSSERGARRTSDQIYRIVVRLVPIGTATHTLFVRRERMQPNRSAACARERGQRLKHLSLDESYDMLVLTVGKVPLELMSYKENLPENVYPVKVIDGAPRDTPREDGS
jgi:hypothetical protein